MHSSWLKCCMWSLMHKCWRIILCIDNHIKRVVSTALINNDSITSTIYIVSRLDKSMQNTLASRKHMCQIKFHLQSLSDILMTVISEVIPCEVMKFHFGSILFVAGGRCLYYQQFSPAWFILFYIATNTTKI